MQEAAIQHGAARYKQASQNIFSARETELAAFASVIRGLEEANTATKRIRALGRNHDLWSTLVKDIALDANMLPQEIKNNLITLGAWSMRYSTHAILQDLPIQPLIDINRNVSEGIAQQVPAPATTMPTVTSASTAA